MEALGTESAGHFLFVARDDRDGRSRYRAAKMSCRRQDELGWYREIFAPIVMIGAFSFARP